MFKWAPTKGALSELAFVRRTLLFTLFFAFFFQTFLRLFFCFFFTHLQTSYNSPETHDCRRVVPSLNPSVNDIHFAANC